MPIQLRLFQRKAVEANRIVYKRRCSKKDKSGTTKQNQTERKKKDRRATEQNQEIVDSDKQKLLDVFEGEKKMSYERYCTIIIVFI